MTIAAKTIKPQVTGVSDKFSSRLYRYIRANKRFGPIQVFNVTQPGDKPQIYLGDHCGNILTGARLNSIVCAQPKVWARMLSADTIVEDISEKFWAEYMRIGVCSIHNHGHMWVGTKKKQQCSTCGKREVLRVKITKSLEWVEVKEALPMETTQ